MTLREIDSLLSRATSRIGKRLRSERTFQAQIHGMIIETPSSENVTQQITEDQEERIKRIHSMSIAERRKAFE